MCAEMHLGVLRALRESVHCTHGHIFCSADPSPCIPISTVCHVCIVRQPSPSWIQLHILCKR
jgi:hypothetical protein